MVNFISFKLVEGKYKKVAVSVPSLEEYKRLRSLPSHLDNLAKARQGDLKAKLRLVQFNYSGYYPQSLIEGNKLVANAFGIDIDSPDAFEKAKAQLLADPEKYGLLMLERSVNQGGHAVFKREKGKTILENQVRMARLLDVEMDTSAHDCNRVFFATSASDEDLLFVSPELFTDIYNKEEAEAEAQLLRDREANGEEDVPAEAHSANKHFKTVLSLPMPKTSEAVQNPKAEPVATPKAEAVATPKAEVTKESALTYQGIPYTSIIKRYWEMFNHGKEPEVSNRNTLTFELANNLKHICGFDRNLLDSVIPCYDGFTEEEKLQCIDSAIRGKRTQMPKNLKAVLSSLASTISDKDAARKYVRSLDELYSRDELFYYNQLPKKVLTQGIKDSIDAAGHSLAMPVLIAISPCIGARATGVQLVIHGKPTHLNLISYIAGSCASGKGQMDDIIRAWMADDIANAKHFNQLHDEWREKYKTNRNKKELPPEPRFPKVWLTLNNTTANLAESLGNVKGKHAFSFTPEADAVSQQWKSTISDFSVMVRIAFDGTSFDREAKSVDAASVHIDELLWNICMCGTPDALYRVVQNYTDGLQTRIAVASTPDNTYSPLALNPSYLTETHKARIMQVSHLLPFFRGTVELPHLEQKSRQWIEEIRLLAQEKHDDVMARQRMRTAVIAQRMTCCMMLAAVASKLIKEHGSEGAERQLKDHPELWMNMVTKLDKKADSPFMELFDIIADSLMENNLYYFRDRIESATHSSDYCGSKSIGFRARRGKNDIILEHLPATFSFDDALQKSLEIKGSSTTINAVQQMLKNWRNSKVLEFTDEGSYHKLSH